MTPSTLRDTIAALFHAETPDDPCGSLCIPRPFIAFCKGEVSAALFLSQLLYWADRTKDEDGWVAKSYADWEREIGLTEYQVKRVIRGDKRSPSGFAGLLSIGVEVLLRASKHYGGAATLHYRINREVLTNAVLNFVKNAPPNIVRNAQAIPPNIVRNAPPNNVQKQYTEITSTETTEVPETTKQVAARTPERKTKPAPKPVSEWQQWVGFCMDFWKCESGKATKFAQLLNGTAKGGIWGASKLAPAATLREAKGWRHWIEQSGRRMPTTPDWVQESFTEFRQSVAYQDAIRDANEPKPTVEETPVVPNPERARQAREMIAALAESKSVASRGAGMAAYVH